MRKGDFEFLRSVESVQAEYDGMAVYGPAIRRANRLVAEGILTGPTFGGCEDLDKELKKQEPGEYPIYSITEVGTDLLQECDENSLCGNCSKSDCENREKLQDVAI